MTKPTLSSSVTQKVGNYRWTICALLFFATTINYLDRQVLSLLQPMLAEEFGWTDSDYGTIVGVFSIVYAASMLFAGRFIDWLGTKKGYAWSIIVWSIGAILHAFATFIPGRIFGFTLGRTVLAIGEAGNFPAAIKATAEYFPKKERAFATGIFNSGANVGAILAPIVVPWIAYHMGWQWAFIIIGAVGFVWLIAWLIMYEIPSKNKNLSAAEYMYIHSDDIANEQPIEQESEDDGQKFSFIQCLKYRQTWSFAFGKFMTDGVWWFFLFWTPAYLKAQYGMEGIDIQWPIALLYTITVIGSVGGGAFPTYFINKGMEPYAGRMKAMFIIALFPLVIIGAQYLGQYSYWWAMLLIGIGGSAHQAWSANIFTTVSDMFPKKATATIVGIGGMAGGIGSFLINKGSGMLFDYSETTWGSKEPGYTIVFCICAVAYLIAWSVMKSLVPKMTPLKM
ncbi:MFS transporter [Pontibacter qinzhouensis]|uniref:MFS transporter n=1 Tax=Pontibacter qinzhouensis TaxID=2603253 RepID=A0A5C8KBI2_9BACT|nr:MFS transporter [Pontibacter qinzhouensis]TXK49125.1 MFS transporter [Pontibacter qinzhouensis]